MPTFKITGPDGKSYKVTGDNAQGALNALKGHLQAAPMQAAEIQGPPIPTERSNDIGSRADALQDMEGGGSFQAANIARDSMVPFSDEMAAGVGSLRGLANGNGLGEEYQREMEAIDLARKRSAMQHPVATGVGGGAGLALTMGRAAPVQAAAAVPGLGSQVLRGAATGAAVGGVQGAGEGQGWDRLQNAESGAKFGAVLGGALPAAVAAGSGAARLAGRTAAPLTQPIKNAINPGDQAAEAFGRALKRDNIGVDDFAAKLAAARKVNPEVVAADLGGANVRGVTRTAVNVPGSGREKLLSEMEDRAAGQGDRISKSLSSVLADPANFGKTVQRLAVERETKAGPLYQAAFKAKQPVDVSGVVKYIDDKLAPGITGLANPASDLRPDSIQATVGRLRSFFATAKNQRVDLKSLHNVKVEIDDMISVAKRSGENSKVRALMNVKTRLLKAMDVSSPQYKAARGIFSDTHTMDDALELGQNVFSMSPADIRTATMNMTKSEREMVQLGTARAIRDKIDTVKDGADVVKAVFSTPKIRDSLRTAFGDDQAFRKMQAVLMREKGMRRTFDAARGNSTTTMQAADMMDLGHGVGRDAMSHLIDLQPLKAASAGIKQILFGQQGINEKVADSLANMLLSKDPAAIQHAIATLRAKQVSIGKVRAILNSITQAGTAAGANAYPSLTAPTPNGPMGAQ